MRHANPNPNPNPDPNPIPNQVRWLRGKNEAEDKGPRLKGARAGEEDESVAREAPRAAPKGLGAADMLGGSTQMADGSQLVLAAAAEGSWAAGRVQKISSLSKSRAAAAAPEGALDPSP